MFSTIIVGGARLQAGESPAFKMDYDHKDGHIDLPPLESVQCMSMHFRTIPWVRKVWRGEPSRTANPTQTSAIPG